MPKVIWKGHINFGLVNVPVRLHSATRKNRLDFHLVDRRDENPVGYVKINKETGREVRPDEIARAIETEDGQLVLLEDQDFEQADPEASRALDIRHFVRLEQISPAFFEKPYFLAPMEGAEKSYGLLREVIAETGRVGIAKVVLRRRERLAAVMARDDVLVLELLRFSQELRDPGELDLPDIDRRSLGITTDEMEMATELVRRMTEEWKPEAYRDEYREQLEQLIEQKASRGREVPTSATPQAPSEVAEAPQEDLSESLRRSIGRTGG